jgi:hypothetical protein
MTVRLIRSSTRGSSSWPGEQSPTRGRIRLRRLYFVQESLLAVGRRTIHCRKLALSDDTDKSDKRMMSPILNQEFLTKRRRSGSVSKNL